MLNRRNFIALAPATLAASQVVLSGCAEAQTAMTTAAGSPDRVAAAAGAFLDLLSPEQREQVLYDSGDPALRNWIYFPSRGDRNGIAFEDLTEEQLNAAFAVAEAMLSDSGYRQFRGIIAAEDELGIRNGEAHVNSGRYFIALFGRPGASGRFTVQINGHHLALNTTYADGMVSPSPAFTGVDPVEIDMGGETVQPMRAKTDACSALLTRLSEEARAAAEIGAMGDVAVGTGSSNRYPEPAGTLVTDLAAEDQERVAAVVRAWVGDATDEVAEQLVQLYRADFGQTRMGWSGTTDPYARGAYLRLDGPRLWIEFSNVGRFGNGDNHFHTIYRDKQADYLA
ncbi:DUF3500 domain-containing protein [Paroceanicella profunda]|uniref:DUF3500 domain-containing protein n=1 Tax=Paroceanicella profunda TaxID=2579971 RepID=A0A5B8G387_9RHOB|nr:DUF3500 domain-containing protein [Paroceanicella profunda]QDL93163.1 DUF3500 domain-containing protein [Paroceanicella profunda]